MPSNRVVAKRSSRALSAAVAVCLALAGCGSDSSGTDSVTDAVSDKQKSLWEEARSTNNGKLTVFVGSSGSDELEGLKAAFAKDFGGVELEWISGTSDTIQERFVTERRAGLSNADVIALAGIASYDSLETEGFLERFTPEEADLYTYDPAGYQADLAYSFGDLNLGVCYNPNNVSEEEIALLKTYQGWTDPRWQGRSAILSDEGYGPRRSLSYWLYQDPKLGKPWLDKVAANRPIVYKSANTAAPQVIAGEYDVIFNAQTVQGPRAAAEGAPLECTTAEYSPTYTFATALASRAPNAAAGKLFINWILSEDGQRAVQENLAYNARRKGFDEPVLSAEWWQRPTNAPIPDEALVVANQEDLRHTFENSFGHTQDG